MTPTAENLAGQHVCAFSPPTAPLLRQLRSLTQLVFVELVVESFEGLAADFAGIMAKPAVDLRALFLGSLPSAISCAITVCPPSPPGTVHNLGRVVQFTVKVSLAQWPCGKMGLADPRRLGTGNCCRFFCSLSDVASVAAWWRVLCRVFATCGFPGEGPFTVRSHNVGSLAAHPELFSVDAHLFLAREACLSADNVRSAP